MQDFFAIAILLLATASESLELTPDLDLDGVLKVATERALQEISSDTNLLLLKHRTTPLSRQMELRNRIFGHAASLLSPSFPNSTELDLLLHEALDRQQSASLGAVAGSALTGAPNLVQVLCSQNAQVNCQQTGLPADVRTYDGRCNNLQNPLWGSANDRVRRFLPPRYADGRRVPRGGFASRLDQCRRPALVRTECNSSPANLLPNPRHVSTSVHRDVDRPDVRFTHMLTQFGQFVDHDLTLFPEVATVATCPCTADADQNCLSFEVPCHDPFHQHAPGTVVVPGNEPNKGCMQLTRSVPYCDDTGSVREQINVNTAFVDASMVYGSSEAAARSLRDKDGLGAKLKTSGSLNLLPTNPANDKEFAGDARAREVPFLTAIHTIFMREHNRLADELLSSFPGMPDEVAYQTCRRLVGAMIQRIVFGEYLPVVLGENTVRSNGLGLYKNADGSVIPSVYNAKEDPSMRNAFSTAAFRYGHTMIDGLMRMINTVTGAVERTLELKDHFEDMSTYRSLQGKGMDQILKGLITEASQTYDQFLVDDITNFLFTNRASQVRSSFVDRHYSELNNTNRVASQAFDRYPDPPVVNGTNKIASDLAARNIQRGRDHGLPGYNAYREFCGLPKACSWSSPPAEVDAAQWTTLSLLYGDPDDIDLFTAGLVERPHDGGVVGRTFNCLIARQFKSVKDGDRFFFNHAANHAPYVWTASLKRFVFDEGTLADVICRNSDVREVRENVFRGDSPMLPCCTVAGVGCRGKATNVASILG